jgi:hypothetical protein
MKRLSLVSWSLKRLSLVLSLVPLVPVLVPWSCSWSPNGGAKSQKGTSGNAINGIGPNNRNGSDYLKLAEEEFG